MESPPRDSLVTESKGGISSVISQGSQGRRTHGWSHADSNEGAKHIVPLLILLVRGGRQLESPLGSNITPGVSIWLFPAPHSPTRALLPLQNLRQTDKLIIEMHVVCTTPLSIAPL